MRFLELEQELPLNLPPFVTLGELGSWPSSSEGDSAVRLVLSPRANTQHSSSRGCFQLEAAGQSCVLVAVRAQPPQQIRAATARALQLTCCTEQRLAAPCLSEEGSTKLTKLNACRLLQQATGIFLQLARKPCLKSLCI